MLNHILRDREFSSSDEIEDAIAQTWNDLTLDDVQSEFRDWIRVLPRSLRMMENPSGDKNHHDDDMNNTYEWDHIHQICKEIR
jgi:hypothetical protein